MTTRLTSWLMTLVEDVFVIAGGGHSRVVVDTLLSTGKRIRGIIDPKFAVGSQLLGVPVLGGDEVIDALAIGSCLLANGIGANPETKSRSSTYIHLVKRGFRFVSVIHPSATIGREVVLAESCQVLAGAVLQSGTKIGSNAVINTSASVDHDVVISDNAFIAPGAIICGNVTVGVGSFVGAGATILPGVHIGAGAVVAAGALVRKDVADGGWHYLTGHQ